MLRFLSLIIVLIMNNNALASKQISNLITPVSYFVDHVKQLGELKNNLSKYRKTSLVGTSGIGKTQLARTFAYENKDQYDLIWFFDCNLDMNVEFIKLAKQLNHTNNASITANALHAKKEVMVYLANKEGWLLVFDNLKVGDNSKVKDLVDWEHNGNVIFCSQEVGLLPHTIKIPKFKQEDATTLANNILENSDPDSAKFLADVFKGYPILIVQGAQLLNQVKGLNKEEYRKKIYKSADRIKLNITLATEKLTPSAKKLLNKIALINNQSFSKQVLGIITDSKKTLNDDIYQLSKFALISNINATESNPIYEMHDVISQKILEMRGNAGNKNALEDIISKFLQSIPRNVIKSQIFREVPTISETLAVINQNAEKYDISIYRQMELKQELITQYVNTIDLYNAKILVDWFLKNDSEGKFNLWTMSNDEKGNYARYIAMIGWYHRRCANPKKTIDYFVRALDIYNKIKGFESFECNTYFGLAIANLGLGEVQKAEQNIVHMEQMFDKNLVDKTDLATLMNIKARLYGIQGKYQEGLEYINKTIDAYLESGAKSTDLFLMNLYVWFKVDMLNWLGKYNEALLELRKLCKINKISNKKNSKLFGTIYTQLARTELGLGETDKALKHINEALEVFIPKENTNTDFILEDPDLAAAYVVQGDVLFAKNMLNEAIESYRDAQKIYVYLYKNNINNVAIVSYLYTQGV